MVLMILLSAAYSMVWKHGRQKNGTILMSSSSNRQIATICDKTLADAMTLARGEAERVWIMARWESGPSARVWFELDGHVYSAYELEWEHGGDDAYPVFCEIEPLIVSVIENDLWALSSYNAMVDGQCLCLVTGFKTMMRLASVDNEKEWAEASDKWINRLNERLSGVASTGSIIDR